MCFVVVTGLRCMLSVAKLFTGKLLFKMVFSDLQLFILAALFQFENV